MKILHINGVNAGGGLEQYLAQLFYHLSRQGHENIFLYGEHTNIDQSPFDAKEYLISGITQFHCLNIKAKLKELLHVIHVEKPDIVLIHQVLQDKLIELVTKTLPSVRFVHGFKLICPEGKKILHTVDRICNFPMGYLCQIRAYIYKCMPRNPTRGLRLLYKCKRSLNLHCKRSSVVVASHFMKDVLIYNGFPEEKIRVIPYFTDLPSIEKNETINRPPHILALGRITKEKGFDCLIRAYSAIQGRAHLTIVGDGPELTNLKQLAEKLRIASTVHFTGWLSHERLDELYRQCALVVVPSIWPEPFCIVGIEAMAYAKPVIAFDVGGISDWLKDGKTGYLIRLKDIEDLTSKIDFSLKNRQLSIEMGHAGRAAAEKYFTAEIHCESLLNLLQKAIDNHVV